MAIHETYEVEDYRGAQIELTLVREYDDERIGWPAPMMGDARFPWIDAAPEVVGFRIAALPSWRAELEWGSYVARDRRHFWPYFQSTFRSSSDPDGADGREVAAAVSHAMVDALLSERSLGCVDPEGALAGIRVSGYRLEGEGYRRRWVREGGLARAA